MTQLVQLCQKMTLVAIATPYLQTTVQPQSIDALVIKEWIWATCPLLLDESGMFSKWILIVSINQSINESINQ